MRDRLSLTEVVGEAQHLGVRYEVCANAEGLYEESTARLVVRLDCWLRAVITAEQGKKSKPIA